MSELRPSLKLRTAGGAAARITSEPCLVPVVTLVVWLGCAVVGVLGFVLPYSRAQWQRENEHPVVAQLIEVALKQEAMHVTPAPERKPPPLESPPPAPSVVIPPSPTLFAVAESSPEIAFAVPVEVPAQIVAASEASYRTPAVAPQSIAESIGRTPEPLTFGYGAGKQPAPGYPRQALREGQEGTVLVRFTVGENGRVLTAEAAKPSPWPLLNHAAVRAVREQWRFPAGPVRAYEVPIHFQIKR